MITQAWGGELPTGKFFKLGTLRSPRRSWNDIYYNLYFVLPVLLLQLVKSLEAIETKLPETTESREQYYQILDAEILCGLASFLKVAIVCKHASLNFAHISPAQCIRSGWHPLHQESHSSRLHPLHLSSCADVPPSYLLFCESPSCYHCQEL